MIKSFKHAALQRFYETSNTRGLNAQHVRRYRMILQALNVATSARDMDLPGLNCHNLAPARPATWSVKVNGPWRITFGFTDGHAVEVDLEQYH